MRRKRVSPTESIVLEDIDGETMEEENSGRIGTKEECTLDTMISSYREIF